MNLGTIAKFTLAVVVAIPSPIALAHEGHVDYPHLHLHLGNYISLQWLVIALVALVAVGLAATFLPGTRFSSRRAVLRDDDSAK